MRSSWSLLAPLTFLLPALSGVACSTETIKVVHDPAPAPAEETPPAEEPTTETPPETKLPKPSFPKVLSRGGPVITKPRVVPIVYSGDALASQIDSFDKKLAASSYWTGVAKEYGIGAITAGDMITLDEAAPTAITSTEIESWLVQKLSGASPEFGQPDPSTLYAIYYPAQTTITMEGAGEMGQSCQGYGGYHFEVQVGATTVGYAVMPRCAGIDDLTVAASHEYFEWATDPFPQSKPAYNKLDDEHWAWQATMIGELSDLCTFLDQEYLRPAELGFQVQRHWSNALSLGGSFPCAPKRDAAYSTLVPFPEDEATVPDYGSPNDYITTKAVRVDLGKSRTVDLTLYSDQAASSALPIVALSYAEFYRTGQPSPFKYSLDSTRAKAGDTVKLTIQAPSDVNYDLVVLTTYGSAHTATFWPLLVTAEDAPVGGGKKPTVTPATLPKKGGIHRLGTARIPVTQLGTPVLQRAAIR